MSLNVSHEWSDDGDCTIDVNQNLPCWKFSLWDIAGIAFGTAGGVLISLGTGLGYINRECQAHAQWKRSRFDAAEHDAIRAEMAASVDSLVFPDSIGDLP